MRQDLESIDTDISDLLLNTMLFGIQKLVASVIVS